MKVISASLFPSVYVPYFVFVVLWMYYRGVYWHNYYPIKLFLSYLFDYQSFKDPVSSFSHYPFGCRYKLSSSKGDMIFSLGLNPFISTNCLKCENVPYKSERTTGIFTSFFLHGKKVNIVIK